MRCLLRGIIGNEVNLLILIKEGGRHDRARGIGDDEDSPKEGPY